MKLSNNFYAHEFLHDIEWEDLSLPNQFLLKVLCDTVLQPIRDFLAKEYGREIILNVSSGVRDEKDVDRLIKQGYHPSSRSDHFYSNAIKTTSSRDRKRFGKYFTYGAGAADIIPEGVSIREVFDKICDGIKSGRLDIKYGQIIFEKRTHSTGWIHISNSKTRAMSAGMIDAVDFSIEGKLMMSLDNGKTYKVV